jgi:hypothetical protein
VLLAPPHALEALAGLSFGDRLEGEIARGKQPEEAAITIYPLEFYRRAEEKWRRRSESLRAAVTESPPNKKGDDALVRWPWLLAIGQGLQSEYAAFEQALPPKRLVALLKKLTRLSNH